MKYTEYILYFTDFVVKNIIIICPFFSLSLSFAIIHAVVFFVLYFPLLV